MAWWQYVPSLTPLRGVSRFFYVCTHYRDIDVDLKKRDDRLEAVEQALRQIARLREEAHAAEAAHKDQLLASTRASVDSMIGEFHGVALGLAVMLYIEEAPSVRESMLKMMTPFARDVLNWHLN